MSERRTNKMCPECDEEYLVEVREPGVIEPVEVFCPACGFTADTELAEEEEQEEADAEVEEIPEDIEGLEIDEEEEEY
jgi:hypothetical protein